MSIESTQQIISESVTIPTIPEVVAKINTLSQDPLAGTREIGELVAQDAPLSSKILRIANSAFYGLRQRVLSTEHAAAVLGVRVLRNIVLQASVMSQYEHLASVEDFDLNLLWKHSILTGQVARFTASKCKSDLGLEPEELYTCGLLHDVGKVVMVDSMMDEYLAAARDSVQKQQAIELSEEEILGFNHMEVGAMIAMRWGLPTGVVKSIQYHHGPLESVLKDVCVAIVYLADRISEHVELEREINTREVFYPGMRRILGLDEADFGEIVDFTRESWPEIEI